MTNAITSKILIRVNFFQILTLQFHPVHTQKAYSPPRPFSVCIIFPLAKVAS